MLPDTSSLARGEKEPIAIAEILPAVLARYALAGTVCENPALNPPQHTIFSVTVVETRG
jgi:hypothetical protein